MLQPTSESLPSNKSNIKAMILAAGLGTRLKPWTDHHPKALAVVNGKSLLQRNIEYLQHYGITEVVVNVHHFADQIEEAIAANEGWGSAITISNERDAVLETGGGLVKAATHLQDTSCFVLLNVDILTDLDLSAMIKQHLQEGALATLATRERQTSRYLLFNQQDTLCGWRNVNNGEYKWAGAAMPNANLKEQAFSGVHVISPTIFGLIRQTGKFSMIDVYLDLALQHTIKSFDHSKDKFIDVGKPEAIIAAEALFI